MNSQFQKFSHMVSEWTGRPLAFILSFSFVILWALAGPSHQYSDTWQLVVNTSTTIITFLMVFLIQNTQNRDARAIHLKLDELIRAHKGARNHLINVQDLSDSELDQLHNELCLLQQQTNAKIETIKLHKQKGTTEPRPVEY